MLLLWWCNNKWNICFCRKSGTLRKKLVLESARWREEGWRVEEARRWRTKESILILFLCWMFLCTTTLGSFFFVCLLCIFLVYNHCELDEIRSSFGFSFFFLSIIITILLFFLHSQQWNITLLFYWLLHLALPSFVWVLFSNVCNHSCASSNVSFDMSCCNIVLICMDI